MKNLLKFDILLQWRQGFWTIYSLVTFMYLVVIFNLPEGDRGFISAMLVFSDTSILGMTFVGALILLEKQQRVFTALFVTPMPLKDFLLSKAVSLTFISLFFSFLLFVIPNGIDFSLPVKLYGVAASSLIFTFYGLGVSAKWETLNNFLGGVILGTSWVILPLAAYFYFSGNPLLLVFPPNAVLDLMLTGKADLFSLRVFFNVFSLAGWIFLARYFALRRFRALINSKSF